jgi:hypothetical protein
MWGTDKEGSDHDAKERAELLSVNHDSASFATGYCVA